MNTLLMLRNIRVENANAINGLTWGFPAITQFLGFMHALQRKFPPTLKLQMEKCGVICHKHSLQTYGSKEDQVFGLTRNPLTEKGKTAPFNEEGRMHLTLTLVISCKGWVDDGKKEQQKVIEQLALSQRLAGGTIIDIGEVSLLEVSESEEEHLEDERKWLRKLLPGFALVQRSDLMPAQLKAMSTSNPETDVLDAWLAFSSLRFEPEPSQEQNGFQEQNAVLWRRIARAEEGWLVPIALGYRGISDLYAPGKTRRARDPRVPFRFVESVYTIGQWISPHRLKSIQDVMWGYLVDPDNGWYLCTNEYVKHKTIS